MIAIIVQDINNPFYAALAEGLQRVLSPEGYRVVVCNTGGEPGGETHLIEDMVSRQVDGLVVASFKVLPRDCDLAVEQGVPVVVIGKKSPGAFDKVRADEFAAAHDMTKLLIDAGYEDIVHVAGGRGQGPTDERVDGYRHAMAGAGLFPEIISTEFTLSGGAKAFLELLNARRMPRAVFCANDLIAIGVLRAAQEHGIRVPQDLAVAGIDDIEAASLVSPALTTVRNPAAEYDRSAGRLLMDRLQGSRAAPVDHVVRLEIVRRDSA
jgi:LacI family transcriptional regulator